MKSKNACFSNTVKLDVTGIARAGWASLQGNCFSNTVKLDVTGICVRDIACQIVW